MNPREGSQHVRVVDDALLRHWKLPMPGDDGDKEERGRALIIAGSREMPGAALLAANAAFRAGAGKVTVAIGESVAQAFALQVPETRVIALPESKRGGVAPASHAPLVEALERVDAVLIGPGMIDTASVCECVVALLPSMRRASVVLDAAAMDVLLDANGPCVERFDSPVLLTPHAGEMAHLTGRDKSAIESDSREAVSEAARRWNAVVALKGATTWISRPDGALWRHDGGNVGLAVSGSGDTLAGIVVGLAARGAPLEQAAAWAVALHARAGERLAQRVGTIGYLARELPAEVPALMRALGGVSVP